MPACATTSDGARQGGPPSARPSLARRERCARPAGFQRRTRNGLPGGPPPRSCPVPARRAPSRRRRVRPGPRTCPARTRRSRSPPSPQTLAGAGLPQPGRVVLIAPWLDLTLANPGIPDAEARDPWLTSSSLREAGRGWAGGDDPAQPRLSPVNGPLDRLAPVDVCIGTRDLFYPAVRRLAERAAREGAAVHVTVCEGAVHVYPLVPAPEGRAAARAIVRSAAS
ncbi:alpha/beta hydrolase fold domain-containing protein [Streptomyces sp. NPDC048291]|uniref:alpha/beta hydrolase fold domain-containing protein n=1 Tax=Streptomyces sp. NPDC048291 TaxID=3365530 RepID=UPI00370FC949